MVTGGVEGESLRSRLWRGRHVQTFLLFITLLPLLPCGITNIPTNVIIGLILYADLLSGTFQEGHAFERTLCPGPEDYKGVRDKKEQNERPKLTPPNAAHGKQLVPHNCPPAQPSAPPNQAIYTSPQQTGSFQVKL